MDELKIDIEATSKKTHISVMNLNYLFNLEFGKLNQFKTNSFISIIQRDMGYDLEELRTAANNYYKNHNEDQSILIKEYKENRPKKNKLKYILISLGAISLMIILYFLLFTNNSSNISNYSYTNDDNKSTINTTTEENNIEVKKEIPLDDNQKISIKEEPVNTNIDKNLQTKEENIATDTQDNTKNDQEQNIEQNNNEVVQKDQTKEEEKKKVELSIKLKSNKKVWIGITYLDTLKTEDFTVKEFEFDPKRDFVAVFGHNFVKIITQDKTIDFSNDRDKRRISYIDGKVEIITKKKLIKIVKQYQSNR